MPAPGEKSARRQESVKVARSRRRRRQGSVNAAGTGPFRVWNGGVSDLIYILLTLVCFAGLALLVGLIDRRLGAADTDPEASPEPSTPVDAGAAG